MAPDSFAPALQLPISVIGPVDIGRLIRELEALDSLLSQQELRPTGAAAATLPVLTPLCQDVLSLNQVDLPVAAQRQQLLASLVAARTNSPQLHISFSVQPSASFMEKLLIYLRRELDPAVLVTIGLQPDIGAGCLVRTTNKQFDFSLRKKFASNRDLLMATLREKAAA